MSVGVQVLDDVLFPDEVAALGVSGVNQRRNQRTVNQAGFTMVTRIYSRTLREYTVGIHPMTAAAWLTVEALHEITEGGAFGMLLRDPKDSRVSLTDGKLQGFAGGQLVGVMGQGFGVPTYRLHKRYAAMGTSRTHDRRITRPMPTPSITRGGSPVTVGGGAGQISIDLSTGTVTFVADASQSIQSITVGATTVLNFANGTGIVAALSVGQRVYLSGITGTAATTLNGLSHEVTNVGATSLTIATTTTGLTATGGTAAKYPQASEALAWSGGFYVPVHFASDEIDWTFLAGDLDEGERLLAGPSVVLVEIREQ
jgi:uncharacterized protein (TIGR02217 family)